MIVPFVINIQSITINNPKIPPKNTMTTTEIREICDFIQARLTGINLLAGEIWKAQVMTGLRVREVLTLPLMIIGETGRNYLVKTLKGSSIRVIPKIHLSNLLTMMAVNQYPMEYGRYRKMLIRVFGGKSVYLKGKKCVTHLPRHLFAKELYKGGMSKQEVANEMGVSTTVAEKYIWSDLKQET